jgi:very-short-patch-repair endonuclease
MRSPVRIIDELGRRQLGLVTRPRLCAAGVSLYEQRKLIEAGQLVPEQVGVYRTFGTPPSWELSLLAACLAAGPGAVASHRAAAALWGLCDQAAPAEITVTRPHCPVPRNAVLHRSTDLTPDDVVVLRGIPVTKPARTACDLGAVAPFEAVAHLVEKALVKRLFTLEGVWCALRRVARKGRSGAGVLRAVLEQRALRDKRPESLLEVVMADLCLAFGVDNVEYQYRVVVEGQKKRIDFAIPAGFVGLEIVGLEDHATRHALDNDVARKNLLQRHGWLILDYTVTDLRRRRRAMVKEFVAVARDRITFLDSVSVA